MKLFGCIFRLTGIFFLLLSIFLIAGHFYYSRYIAEFQANGVKAEAVIVNKQIIETKEIVTAQEMAKRSNKTPKTVLAENRLEYEFITNKGQKQKGHQNVYRSEYFATNIGDKIQIIYLPEKPNRNMGYEAFAKEDGKDFSLLFMAIPMFIIGLVMTFFSGLMFKILDAFGVTKVYKELENLTNKNKSL